MTRTVEITTEGTPLTDEQKSAFVFIRESDDVAVMSGYVNGEHTAIIVRTTDVGDQIKVTPLYVAITPDMVLTNADGASPKRHT